MIRSSTRGEHVLDGAGRFTESRDRLLNKVTKNLSHHAFQPKVGILNPLGKAFASGQRVVTTFPRV